MKRSHVSFPCVYVFISLFLVVYLWPLEHAHKFLYGPHQKRDTSYADGFGFGFSCCCCCCCCHFSVCGGNLWHKKIRCIGLFGCSCCGGDGGYWNTRMRTFWQRLKQKPTVALHLYMDRQKRTQYRRHVVDTHRQLAKVEHRLHRRRHLVCFSVSPSLHGGAWHKAVLIVSMSHRCALGNLKMCSGVHRRAALVVSYLLRRERAHGFGSFG